VRHNRQRVGDGTGLVANGQADPFGAGVYRKDYQGVCQISAFSYQLSVISDQPPVVMVMRKGMIGSQGHQPGVRVILGEAANCKD
jgi:hypothetical protein